MKKFGTLLVIIFCTLALKVEAQDFPRDSLTQKIDFVGVVPAAGYTKSSGFDRGLVILHRMYKQADTKISVTDKDNGIIVLNGFTQLMEKTKSGVMAPNPELVLYKLTLSFKNGKYRYEFTDFVQNRAGTVNHIEKWIDHNVPGDHFYSKEDKIPESLAFLYADIQKRIDEIKTGMLGDKTIEKKDW